MWDRNKKVDSPEPASEARATAAAPAAARPVEAQRRNTTEIGKSISIIGDIYSEEDLFIDGQVEGELAVKDSLLTVGPNGRAKSNVKAREVIILGEVRGNIDAELKISIRKQGSVVGNIRTMGIVIDDDAYFKGSIDIVRKGVDPAAA